MHRGHPRASRSRSCSDNVKQNNARLDCSRRVDTLLRYGYGALIRSLRLPCLPLNGRDPICDALLRYCNFFDSLKTLEPTLDAERKQFADEGYFIYI